MYRKYGMFFVVLGTFCTVQASYWVVPQDHVNISLHQSVYWKNEAVVVNYIETTKILDINTQDAYGDTALIIASRCGRALVVGALLKKGAIVNIQNQDKKDASMVAMNREIFRKLKPHVGKE